ncbi:hypothetical protein ALC53_13471 [Atta colombica]|uniref:Uncharacterized protein n=1 Tax=Atta colombica TaxID=520822 RepID=A0A195AUY3_9HYME|nr:hypothetical protein ALC53_13471 [Atta colombica]
MEFVSQPHRSTVEDDQKVLTAYHGERDAQSEHPTREVPFLFPSIFPLSGPVLLQETLSMDHTRDDLALDECASYRWPTWFFRPDLPLGTPLPTSHVPNSSNVPTSSPLPSRTHLDVPKGPEPPSNSNKVHGQTPTICTLAQDGRLWKQRIKTMEAISTSARDRERTRKKSRPFSYSPIYASSASPRRAAPIAISKLTRFERTCEKKIKRKFSNCQHTSSDGPSGTKFNFPTMTAAQPSLGIAAARHPFAQ